MVAELVQCIKKKYVDVVCSKISQIVYLKFTTRKILNFIKCTIVKGNCYLFFNHALIILQQQYIFYIFLKENTLNGIHL